jgi:hypothetical protein
MKKAKLCYLLIPIIGYLVLFFGCKKTEHVDMRPQLKIVVKNLSEEVVSNAAVELYDSLDYFTSRTNALKTGITDENGTVVFSELNERLYYFYIYLDEKTNLFYINGTSKALETGTITIVATYIN